MKITDLLKNKKPTLSLEIFPPKKDSDLEGVLAAADRLAALNPDFMSVTYGAGGGTSKRTVEIAARLNSINGVTSLAHMTCVTASKGHVANVLDSLRGAGVQNVLALRGDPPREDVPVYTEYRHASDLTADIKKAGDFCVGGACYPDGHPECESRERDIENIKYKVDAGCDFLITQLFFNNDVLYNFLYRLAAHRIDVPVIAGIMPMTSASSIKKMTSMCGAVLTPSHKTILERYADKPEALRQAGMALAAAQIADLAANGVRGVHIYTMNRPEIAGGIYNSVSHLFSCGSEEQSR